MSTNLWQKIQAVMADITHLAKDGTNTHFGYAYVTDEDVLAAVHEQFVKHGLVFLPQMVGVEQASNKTLAQFIFQVIDTESGEKVDLSWFGEANDQQDKGVSKAATSAVKYFLLKFLLIPTGDKSSDPDNESIPAGEQTRPPVRREAARNDGNPADFVIPFGKHKGKTIAQVYSDGNADYLMWITGDGFEAKADTGKRLKIAAAAYLAKQVEGVNDPSPPNAETPPPEGNWTQFYLWCDSLGYKGNTHASKVKDEIWLSDPRPTWAELCDHMVKHQEEKGRL